MEKNKQLYHLFNPTSIENISEEQNEESVGNSCYSFAFKNQQTNFNLVTSGFKQNGMSDKLVGTQLQTQPTTNEQKDKLSTQMTANSNFVIKKKAEYAINNGYSEKTLIKNPIQNMDINNFLRGASMPQILYERQLKKKYLQRNPKRYQENRYQLQNQKEFNGAFQLELQIKKLQSGIHMLKQQKISADLKMMEYDRKIERLKADFENLYQCENQGSDVELMIQLDTLQQQLQEQIEINQDLNKENNQLMKQLKETLCDDAQQIASLNQLLIKEKEENQKLKEEKKQERAVLNKFNQLLNEKDQQIKKLQNKQKSLYELLYTLEEQKKQRQKWQTQHKILNSQMQSLKDNLQASHQQLQRLKTINDQFQQIIKQKERELSQVAKDIEKKQLKLEEVLQENQLLKNMASSDIEEYERQLENNYSQIKNLQAKIVTLQQECLKMEKNNGNAAKLPKYNTLLEFHDQVCSILRLSPTSRNSKILHQLDTLHKSWIKNTQVLHNYYQIFSLFGISITDESCHQKFIEQIYQLRNQMILFEKQTRHLTSQNMKLLNKLKDGFMMTELENMIKLQNQSIGKFKKNIMNQSGKSRKPFAPSTI